MRKSQAKPQPLVVIVFFLGLLGPSLFAQDDQTPEPKAPRLEAASSEGVEAIEQFKMPQGIACELFAAEPMVANIVAFHRDFQGRMFVCETYRQAKGVEDNRRHANWMDEELQAQTVADRLAYIKKYIPDYKKRYTENDDRIRLLLDSNSDGVADIAKVFSDHYNAVEMGTGAGVLSYRNNVYYTNIPSLFLLNDQNDDGVADAQLILSKGYGVRFAFRGHDMHGLIVGPDGRLYFSIGDRGYNVSPEIKDPASGAVFRCDLDGRNLEIVATGLRNPQELAFDDFGNLFTGDNNSDSGDKARFTEIVQGGDAGWRMHYQYINDRGPFNREKIWHPYNEDTPAYVFPPIVNISDGPSGLEYYPGTGFGDRFAGKFFLCDFRGDALQSGIRSFRHLPDGAGWKIEDENEQPIWNILATDLDFGSDGKLYVSDWVFGWEGLNKGRIYAFSDPDQVESDLVKQVESYLKAGFQETETEELVTLLAHKDRRVRQEAQFELVARRDTSSLLKVAKNSSASTLARIHSLWGLEQLARAIVRKVEPASLASALDLVKDQDPQVVIATTKLAASLSPKQGLDFERLLKHDNLRVRFEAAMALNRIGKPEHVASVAAMLAENDNRDATLRHGGIMALVGIFEREVDPDSGPVSALASHDSAAVQLALCVAMRKVMESNRPNTFVPRKTAASVLGNFLSSSEKKIVLEAARAIHDLRIKSEMPKLAKLIGKINQFQDDALIRRILNANFRVGDKAAATALTEFAVDSKANQARRVDAIRWMTEWKNPPARDHLLHDWAPLEPRRRNLGDARAALEAAFPKLMDAKDAIAEASILAAGELQLTSIESDLSKVVLSPSSSSSARVAALRSLDRLQSKDLVEIVTPLQESVDSLPGQLKVALLEVVAKRLPPQRTTSLIDDLLANGTLRQKQATIATLGKMKDPASENRLAAFLKDLQEDKIEPGIRLDVINACKNRKSSPVRKTVKKYLDELNTSTNMVNRYFDTLDGGNADAGRKVFYEKTAANCVRCHKIYGKGGEVGPDLSGVALNRDRKYLLEAIVDPNKTIAKGYAQTKVLTVDGELLVGLKVRENDKFMVLLNAEGDEIEVAQDDIDDTMVGDSSMPTDLHQKLSPNEIRDLVEYLSTCRTPAENSGHEE